MKRNVKGLAVAAAVAAGAGAIVAVVTKRLPLWLADKPPSRLDTLQGHLADLIERLKEARWPVEASEVEWEFGVNIKGDRITAWAIMLTTYGMVKLSSKGGGAFRIVRFRSQEPTAAMQHALNPTFEGFVALAHPPR